MILGMLGVTCLLWAGAWFIYKSTTVNLVFLQLDSGGWLLFSLIVSTGIMSYFLRKFLADKNNKTIQLQLNSCFCLLLTCNILQWDLNHSGWGIGENGAQPLPGLLGVQEPLCVDFLYSPPRISDRLRSCFRTSPENSSLWSDYKAGRR